VRLGHASGYRKTGLVVATAEGHHSTIIEAKQVIRRRRGRTGATIMLGAAQRTQVAIPFDASRLDHLMEEADIDVLLATSKHNVQYLLGGHRAFFFDYMDAMG
jgi:hypothetical protein